MSVLLMSYLNKSGLNYAKQYNNFESKKKNKKTQIKNTA